MKGIAILSATALVVAPTSLSAQNFEVRIRAFIPNEHSTKPGFVRQVPGQSGQTMIPGPGVPYVVDGPIPLIGSCYNTNNRGFSPAKSVDSKASSSISFRHIGGTLSAVSVSHLPGKTTRYNCETGAIECEDQVSAAGITALPPTKMGDIINVAVATEIRNPCVPAPDQLIPAIKWNGIVSIDTRHQTAKYVGTVADFPSYEVYLVVDDGAPIPIIQESPAPASTVWSLLTDRALDKGVKYLAVEGPWREAASEDQEKLLISGSQGTHTHRSRHGVTHVRRGSVQKLNATTYRFTFPLLDSTYAANRGYLPAVRDQINNSGRKNTIDLEITQTGLRATKRTWGWNFQHNNAGQIYRLNHFNPLQTKVELLVRD